MKSIYKKSAQLILTLLIFAALIYAVTPGKLLKAMSELTLEAILMLAGISVAMISISVIKWRIFLKYLSEKVSLWRLVQLYLVGYFVNLVMPSYVGGDAVRSWYIGKKVGHAQALAATILERYTGFFAMIVLALCFMWFSDLATIQVKLAVGFIAFCFFVTSIIALSDFSTTTFAKVPYLKKFAGGFNKVHKSLNLARKNYVLLAQGLSLSFLYHCFTVLNTAAAAYAVGWDNPPLWDIFVVLPLILIIGALPITPSGLGLQEGAFYFFLSGLGATPEQALGIGLVLRAKSYVLALFGGIVWLSVRKENKTGDKEKIADLNPAPTDLN